MRFFHYIDQALLEAEKRVEYAASEPRVWPSEASAEALDKREDNIVGRCHRASYFRLIGMPVTNPSNAKGARRFRMGRACEEDVTQMSRRAGIHVANGVRFFFPDLILPGEIDLVTIDPDNNQCVIVENKSNYGYFAKIDMAAGKPKTSAVMQASMYLDRIPTGAKMKELIRIGMADRIVSDEKFGAGNHRNRIEVTEHMIDQMDDGPLAVKLAYESRDECDTWEFDVSVWTDPDTGIRYPAIDGGAWKLFSIDSIYERYSMLQDYWYKAREEGQRRLIEQGVFPPPSNCSSADKHEWDELIAAEVRELDTSWWPPAEYEFRYTPEKVEFLYAEGLISKPKYDGWRLKKPGKEHMGNWNCAFCSHRSLCVSVQYPQLRSIALDLAEDAA